MNFGQLMDIDMGNIFRKTFAWLGGLGCSSGFYSIYRLTAANKMLRMNL